MTFCWVGTSCSYLFPIYDYLVLIMFTSGALSLAREGKHNKSEPYCTPQKKEAQWPLEILTTHLSKNP